MIYVAPIELSPLGPISFKRARVVPGVTVGPYSGILAGACDESAQTLPVKPTFAPTHMLVVDSDAYLKDLDLRLSREGKHRDTASPMPVDFDGILRQVLTSFTLLGGVGWTFGGMHHFERSAGPKSGYSHSQYSHRPTVAVSYAVRQALASRHGRRVTAAGLYSIASKLDRYYRSGIWWVDRLSVALGYLWSGEPAPWAETNS